MPKRIVCLLLCASLFWGALSVDCLTVYAADSLLTLSQAQGLALSKNKSYKRVKSKISMQQVKYAAAVEAIRLKKKNMSTFRWTPLLSFKFPEKPDLAEEFQWQYKPLQIQTEITQLTHQLKDTKYEVLEKISLLYVGAYIQQEKILFSQERIEALEDTLARNEAKVKLGEAKQAEVDKMKTSLKKLEKDVSLFERSLAGAKRKMSGLLGMDITTGYRLSDPLVTGKISRSMLKSLLEHTLQEDQTMFEAKMKTQLALTSVNLNQTLMMKQYGGKMNSLKAYIDQVKKGKELDEEAFKSAYDQFLIEIDAPWQGKKKILFIRIPKEWFKGAISGVRYVEDDPYALYTAVLDYQDAFQDQESLEKELTDNVTDSFEALVTARNAYTSLKETNAEQKAELQEASMQNKLGALSYGELRGLQEAYEESQMECMDSLASYSELLYAFDRLTCGGITSYLQGERLGTEAAVGGESFLEKELLEGASYYIQSKVEDNVFLFGILIPEDFSIEITDYELWIDGTQIGERVEKDRQIRHLTLALDQPGRVCVHLYQGETLVDQVEIDAQVYQGPLEIQGGYRMAAEEKEKKVARFVYEVDTRLNIAVLELKPEPGEDIAYYQITDRQGGVLYQEEFIPIGESFRYLSIMAKDLSQLKVAFYDAEKQPLYQGKFEELTGSVVVE